MEHLIDADPHVDYTNIYSLLPIKESPAFAQSDRMTYAKVSIEADDSIAWKHLNCGQSMNDNGTFTLFCGGPILAMEWATLPSTYDGNEILAISINANTSKTMMVRGSAERIRSVIQIWSIPSDQSNTREVPKILYAIHCPDGPVVCMKFCPSGGFIAGKRIGLLAIGSFDGKINIIALPDLAELESNDSDDDTTTRMIVETPLLSLRLSLWSNEGATATQISWSHVSIYHPGGYQIDARSESHSQANHFSDRRKDILQLLLDTAVAWWPYGI